MSRRIRKAAPTVMAAAALGISGCGGSGGSGITADEIGLQLEPLADVHVAKEVRELTEGSPAYGATIGRVLKAERIDGAWILQAKPGTPAAAAGLEAGGLITAVDGDDVTTPEEVDAALDDADPGSAVEIAGLYVISGDPTDFLDPWSAEVKLPGGA